LSLPAREAGSVPEQHLVLLYPDRARTHTLVFYLPVAAMKAKAMISMESLISQLKRRLAWLPLNAGTSVVLLGSNQKTKLVDHGPQAGVPPAELMLRAAEAGSLEETVEINSTRVMVRIDYLKPMDWYLVMSTPEDQIMEPVEQFVRQIVGLALGCTIIVTVMAILTAFFFTRPIVKLSKFAAQASELDFTSPSAAEFFSIDSFKKSGDELGLLEEALMTQGRTVVAKVNDLLRATQARERLAGELEAARRIQLGFLPSHRQAVLPERCRLAAYLQPAKEVGGDLYDFFPTPDGREALIIGDVSGKGVPAALFMAITVTLIRQTLAEAGLSPAAAMTRINNQLNANNPDSMFVTLFMGLFDPRTGRLEYANGGHCPPLVAEADRVRYIDQFSGPMVGAIEGVVYEGYEDCLRPGQICLLHTDGVTEAQNEQLEFFGKQRLEEILALAPGRDPEEFNRLVVEAIDAFRGPAEPYDDVTLLSFSWEGGE
jgi:sigma-B regulation protein RsbU (phosphoserine phosphatase)